MGKTKASKIERKFKCNIILKANPMIEGSRISLNKEKIPILLENSLNELGIIILDMQTMGLRFHLIEEINFVRQKKG